MANYLHVPGAQVLQSERDYIKSVALQAVHTFNKPVMVNIGIMWGCTLWCLRAGAPQARIVGVDIAPDKWKITDVDDLNAEIVVGDSHSLWKTFEADIHVLLIDGDHHYESVKQDIGGWVPKVVSGGWVLFHDYRPSPHNLKQFPELEGVRQAVDEYFNSHSEWKGLPLTGSIKAFKHD